MVADFTDFKHRLEVRYPLGPASGGHEPADGYYGASGKYDFGDVDILAVGPIAAQVSVAFDEYWNDRLAIPIKAFVAKEHTGEYLLKLRRKLDAFRSTSPSLMRPARKR